jgi:transcriptional regulator with XRE-family HTH domain
MSRLCEKFGREVRKRRQEFHWSQEALALRAELNRSYLGEIERGTVVPSLDTMAKLASALDTNLAALVAPCDAKRRA